jgi:CheY-like chemotaxis protein
MARALHILVVDDDRDFREGLRGVLEDQGCTVSEAADGALALQALLKVRPHLILFDLEMPVMNGWDFYAEIQKDTAFAAIPIAVISSAAHKRPMGRIHVLRKPLDLNKLMGLLRAIGEPAAPA